MEENKSKEFKRIFAQVVYTSRSSHVTAIEMLKRSLISEAYLDARNSSEQYGVIYAAVDTGDLNHSERDQLFFQKFDRTIMPTSLLIEKLEQGHFSPIEFHNTANTEQ